MPELWQEVKVWFVSPLLIQMLGNLCDAFAMDLMMSCFQTKPHENAISPQQIPVSIDLEDSIIDGAQRPEILSSLFFVDVQPHHDVYQLNLRTKTSSNDNHMLSQDNCSCCTPRE